MTGWLRLAGTWGLWLVALCLGSCGGSPAGRPAASGAKTEALHYTITVSDDLNRKRVRLCFEGAPPPQLLCGVGWGEEFLTAVVAVDPQGEQRELKVEGGRIDLSTVRVTECVVYEINIELAESSYGAFSAGRFGDAMMTTIPLWLWRPPSAVSVPRVRARFELPPGADVSVPWPREGDEYVLDETAFAYKAYAAVGRFDREIIQVPGGTLDVAVLEGLSPDKRAHVRPWLETAAAAASLVGGRFPRERAQVIVVPGRRSSDPVGFGSVTRGGGASVAIRLYDGPDLDTLKRDWVAMHEFTHLWHPFVKRDDAWLSEGTATYYQEVLRVRAGLKSERAAWQRIWDGSLERRWADGTLAQESADMFLNLRFRTVYWGGAAIALMGDVELRRVSEGSQSLDTVLGKLGACCSSTPAPWPAARVVRRMDRISGHNVFSELIRTRVRAPKLPDLTELYAQLGISVVDGQVELADDGPWVWIRKAIMAPRATPTVP